MECKHSQLLMAFLNALCIIGMVGIIRELVGTSLVGLQAPENTQHCHTLELVPKGLQFGRHVACKVD